MGVQAIVNVLADGPSFMMVRKVGDNSLDDDAGKAIQASLKMGGSLQVLDLGSASSFKDFQAHEMLETCRAFLQEIIIRGRSLSTPAQAMFIS